MIMRTMLAAWKKQIKTMIEKENKNFFDLFSGNVKKFFIFLLRRVTYMHKMHKMDGLDDVKNS